jgi:hypothetical protein
MKRPGPPCTLCSHPLRAEIDADQSAPKRAAKKFGIAATTLQRHRSHASKLDEKSDTPSLPPPPTTEREALLDALALAKHGLSRTEMEDMPRLLNAITGISKRLAQLDEEREITEEDLAKSPAFRAVVARFVEALQPYPEVALVVLQALEAA